MYICIYIRSIDRNQRTYNPCRILLLKYSNRVAFGFDCKTLQNQVMLWQRAFACPLPSSPQERWNVAAKMAAWTVGTTWRLPCHSPASWGYHRCLLVFQFPGSNTNTCQELLFGHWLFSSSWLVLHFQGGSFLKQRTAPTAIDGAMSPECIVADWNLKQIQEPCTMVGWESHM